MASGSKVVALHAPKARELTEQQAAFVLAYTSEPGAIGNASEAARRAGYSHATAAVQGGQLLNKPHVREAIDAANRDRLSSEIATYTINELFLILKDKDAGFKVRAQVGIALLDRSGHAPASAGERKAAEDRRHNARNGRALPELTPEQLDEELARIMAERHMGAENAKVIDGTAVETAEPGQDGQEEGAPGGVVLDIVPGSQGEPT